MYDTPDNMLLPRSLPEILQQTIRIYRDNIGPILMTSAAIIIPIMIMQIVGAEMVFSEIEGTLIRTNESGLAEINTEVLNRLIGPFILLAIVPFFVQQILLSGIITFIASESILGRVISPLESLQHIGNRLLPLALAMLANLALMMIVSFLLALAFFLCGLGIGIIIYMGVNLFTLLTPVIILEQVGIREGITRTWSLSKRRFWPVFALMMIVSILILITSSILDSAAGTSAEINYSQIIVSVAFQIVAVPVMPIAITLLYYDTRIRLEGLDIAMEQLDKPDPRPVDLTSPRLPIGLNMSDVSNVVLLSVGFVIFAVVLGVLFGNTMVVTP